MILVGKGGKLHLYRQTLLEETTILFIDLDKQNQAGIFGGDSHDWLGRFDLYSGLLEIQRSDYT